MTNTATDEIVKELVHIKDMSLGTFGGLNSVQLNWKPAEHKWSIGQCFDHLIVSNKEYFKELETLESGKEVKNIWKNIPGLSGFFGHFLLKSLHEESKMKMKAPKVFQPSQSEIKENIIADFACHQDELIGIIEKSDKLDLEKTKIASPVNKFITYSLGDTFNIFVAHERRHYRQAMDVMKWETFPKA